MDKLKATKEVLQKELDRYSFRVKFIKDWLNALSDSFEDRDRAYRLSIELETKEALIEQRQNQLADIAKKEIELKDVDENFSSYIGMAKESIGMMKQDIEKARATKPLTNEAKKNKQIELESLELQYSQISTIYKGIVERYNSNDKKQLYKDASTLKQIISMNQ